MEQTEEIIVRRVGVLDLAKRDQRISGRLLAPTYFGYQIETATPFAAGVLVEIETGSTFLLGEVIRLSPQMQAWLWEVKVEHRVRKSECLPSCH